MIAKNIKDVELRPTLKTKKPGEGGLYIRPIFLSSNLYGESSFSPTNFQSGINAVHWVTTPAGETFPQEAFGPDIHPEEELYYVLSGSAVVYVGDERRNAVPGDAILIPPNVPHGIINKTKEPIEILVVAGLKK
jgi:mannose-6-phosphate isomerase-like protein (cupin superfamily)